MSGMDELAAFGRDLRALHKVLPESVKILAPKIADLIEEEFDAGCDAYGEPWTDLAESTIKRGRFPPPLTDTHAMRESVEVQPRGGTLVIAIDSPADKHRDGGPNLPARKILPEVSLPEKWHDAAANSANLALGRALRRR